MYNMRLTQQDLNNLKLFLDRVDLKGKEVLPFINLLKAISEAREDENKKVGE